MRTIAREPKFFEMPLDASADWSDAMLLSDQLPEEIDESDDLAELAELVFVPEDNA